MEEDIKNLSEIIELCEEEINNNDNNIIYLSLLNKYKKQTAGKNFGEKIKAINQCKGEKLYSQLTDDEQIKLTADLMAIK